MGLWDFISDPFDIFHDEDPNDPTLSAANLSYVATRGWTESAWRAVISQQQRQTFLDNMRRQDAEGKPPVVTAPVEIESSWEIIGSEVAARAEELAAAPAGMFDSLVSAIGKVGTYALVGGAILLAIVVLRK